MDPVLGLELWSVRNSLMEDYAGTLQKVAAVGYKNLELITEITENGLLFGKDLNAKQLRSLLDENGLKAVSCHIVPDEKTDWDRIIDDAKTLGVTNFGCAIAFFTSIPEVVDFSKQMNKDAELCLKNGIQYHYHNHYHEFQKFDGVSIYDTMLENFDNDVVKITFDTYWAMRGGQDPIAWLEKLGKRCDLLHQKDMPKEANPVNWFDHFGPDHIQTLEELIYTTSGDHEFTEVGKGVMDVPAILDTARKHCDVKYIFIEQDKSNMGEIESITDSFKYMSKLVKVS